MRLPSSSLLSIPEARLLDFLSLTARLFTSGALDVNLAILEASPDILDTRLSRSLNASAIKSDDSTPWPPASACSTIAWYLLARSRFSP